MDFFDPVQTVLRVIRAGYIHIIILIYGLSMHRLLPEEIEARALPKSFNGKKAAGIICYEMFDYNYSQMLCSLDIPILFVDSPVIGQKVSEIWDACLMLLSTRMDVLQALRRLGYEVPRDVYLCGFDDSPESRIVTPPLTTIHIHSQIMGFSAVHLLISRIKEPSLNYRTIYTETDLVFRESTGD